VLQFLFTEINYGGRVTDDKDRRLMSNLIKTFCSPQVLEEGYAFSPSAVYTVPACETLAQVSQAWVDDPVACSACQELPMHAAPRGGCVRHPIAMSEKAGVAGRVFPSWCLEMHVLLVA